MAHHVQIAIDVVKTRIQVDPTFKGLGFVTGTRQIIAKEGASTLLTGFGPTAVGYLAQGGAKFAGYEFWKQKFTQFAGDQETAVKYRTAIYLGAASVGECVLSHVPQVKNIPYVHVVAGSLQIFFLHH